jgi:hypothetical protein
MSLLYNYNNPWIMSFNVKVLPIPTPPIKNKHIGVLRYNCFLCITSSNIILCSSFSYLNKIWYSNFSIIMEYDNFVKFSSFKNRDFWFDPLHDWITKSDRKSWCLILIVFVTQIVGRGSFTSLCISSIQMLVEHNGFDFKSIESTIFHIFGYGIW